MNRGLTCDDAVRHIPLYGYGEVSSAMEEELEAHLAVCAGCQAELARHRAYMDALDMREDGADTSLLAACRNDLRRNLEAVPARRGWWFDRIFALPRLHIPFQVPVGAMALVALGWFGARYTPEQFGGLRPGMVEAGLAEPMFSTVRSVGHGASGEVQISVDETNRHVVSGNLEDPRIQALLLNAVREEANPGIRAESLGVLQAGMESEDIRRVLIDAASHDPSAAVRLKALEGLRMYTNDATVRKTLAGVLLNDDNPGVRVQAIGLLTAHHDDSIVGTLQDVMRKEDDGNIREQCERLLEAMRASVGTY